MRMDLVRSGASLSFYFDAVAFAAELEKQVQFRARLRAPEAAVAGIGGSDELFDDKAFQGISSSAWSRPESRM